jgi:hypothetical protein
LGHNRCHPPTLHMTLPCRAHAQVHSASLRQKDLLWSLVSPVALHSHGMGAVLAKAAESLRAAPPIYLDGRATKVSPSGVRVCISAASSALAPDGKGGRSREVCAVSTRMGRRDACGDACYTACSNLPNGPGMRRARAICRRDCTPACDQPPRVAVASFQRIVGGPNGE